MAIIDTRSGPGLTQTLLEIIVNKERLAQSKEDLKLRQNEFALRQEEAIRQAEMQKAAMGGAQAAALLFAGNSGIPGVSKATKGMAPAQLPAFMESLIGLTSGGAQARSAVAGANVAEATTQAEIDKRRAEAAVATGTVDSRIRTSAAGADITESQARVQGATEETQIKQAEANLFNTNLRNQLQAEVLKNDPQRGALAINAWINSGGQMTWAEAKSAAGLTTSDSIDPELRFSPPQAGANVNSESAQKAQTFFPLMLESNTRINTLIGSGVRMNVVGGLLQAANSGTLETFINGLQDPEQQQLIQANRAFSDMYRFSLSGQQSSDAEKASMMLSITPQVDDDDATLAQKANLRNIMIQTVRGRAEGRIGILDAAQAGLQGARALGDPNAIAVWEGILNDAAEATMNGDAPAAPSNIPGAGVPIGDAGNVVDDELRRLFGGG